MFLILSIIFILSANSITAVKLFYYSPQHDNAKEIQDVVPGDLALNVAQPIKFICHGLAADRSVSWYDPMIEAYLQQGYNVIAVDWEESAYDGYFTAIDAISGIAQFLGNYIIQLSSTKSFSLSNVHIIGYSLGAHIAGNTGRYIYAQTNEKIGRVTGLDPAGPLFSLVYSSKRLVSNDAAFVDVIHTDAGGLGISSSLGHIDFYPDGGSSQNSCGSQVGCSHNVAPAYFIEGITSDNFVARKCGSHSNYVKGLCDDNDKAIMGESSAPGVSGDFYLTTNSEAPYGRG